MVNRLSLLTSSGLLSASTDGLVLKQDCCGSKKNRCCGSEPEDDPSSSTTTTTTTTPKAEPVVTQGEIDKQFMDDKNHSLAILKTEDQMKAFLKKFLQDVPEADLTMKSAYLLKLREKSDSDKAGDKARAWLNSVTADALLKLSTKAAKEQQAEDADEYAFLELTPTENAKSIVEESLSSDERAMLDLGGRRQIDDAKGKCPDDGKTLASCLKEIVNLKGLKYEKGDTFCEYAAAVGGRNSYDLMSSPQSLMKLYNVAEGAGDDDVWNVPEGEENPPHVFAAVYGCPSDNEDFLGKYPALTDAQKVDLVAGLFVKTHSDLSPNPPGGNPDVDNFETSKQYADMVVAALKQCKNREKPAETQKSHQTEDQYKAFLLQKYGNKGESLEEFDQRKKLKAGFCAEGVLTDLIAKANISKLRQGDDDTVVDAMFVKLAEIDGLAVVNEWNNAGINDSDSNLKGQIAIAAVKNTPKALEAFQKSAEGIRMLGKGLEKVLKGAVTAHGSALKYAIGMVNKADESNFSIPLKDAGEPSAKLHAKQQNLNKELSLLAVDEWSFALQYVSPTDMPKERFESYVEVCLAAVQKNGKALKYVIGNKANGQSKLDDIKDSLEESKEYNEAGEKNKKKKLIEMTKAAFSKIVLAALAQDKTVAWRINGIKEKIKDVFDINDFTLSPEAEKARKEAIGASKETGKVYDFTSLNQGDIQAFAMSALDKAVRYESVDEICKNVEKTYQDRITNANDGRKKSLKESKRKTMLAITPAAFKAIKRVYDDSLQKTMQKNNIPKRYEQKVGHGYMLTSDEWQEIRGPYLDSAKNVFKTLSDPCQNFFTDEVSERDASGMPTKHGLRQKVAENCAPVFDGLKAVSNVVKGKGENPITDTAWMGNVHMQNVVKAMNNHKIMRTEAAAAKPAEK